MLDQNVILEVKDLVVERSGEVLIDTLSFRVVKGDVLVILGPNGAGKTTLLRALLGLIPYQGQLAWSTRAIGYLPPQEPLQRRDLPPFTIEDFFRLKCRNPEKIHQSIEDVALDMTVLNRPFSALSTGQFQRMLLAWTLLDDPDVLLLDEPASGIDVAGEETLYSLLERYRQQRPLTILMVTHDLQVVWEHATEVMCLNRRAICHGAPLNVLTPQHLASLYGTGVKFYEHRHG